MVNTTNRSPGANRNAKGWIVPDMLNSTAGSFEAPLVLNGNYLWVDDAGKLRISATEPASDTDGTIVGTQTA